MQAGCLCMKLAIQNIYYIHFKLMHVLCILNNYMKIFNLDASFISCFIEYLISNRDGNFLNLQTMKEYNRPCKPLSLVLSKCC